MSFGSSLISPTLFCLLPLPQHVILILQAARALRKGQRTFCLWQGSLVSSLCISFLHQCKVAVPWPGFSFLDWSPESLKRWGMSEMVSHSSADRGNVFLCIHCLKSTIAPHTFHCSPLTLAFTRTLPFLLFLLSPS